MWTMIDALPLIRALQPETRRFNYHLALGGGVLNTGKSDKDLDLYFLPMLPQQPEPEQLLTFLDSIWGPGKPFGGPRYSEDLNKVYPYKRRYPYEGGRVIEVFVIAPEHEAPKAVDGPRTAADVRAVPVPVHPVWVGENPGPPQMPMWHLDGQLLQEERGPVGGVDLIQVLVDGAAAARARAALQGGNRVVVAPPWRGRDEQ